MGGFTHRRGEGKTYKDSVPFRRFWEMYLCFLIRGKQMEFTFEVEK